MIGFIFLVDCPSEEVGLWLHHLTTKKRRVEARNIGFEREERKRRRRRREREESDKSGDRQETASCLAPVRPGCSLFLASFPSFSLWPTPIDRVSPSRCLKARHEAVSFEAAEWSERPTSRRVGWLGAAAAGSIPALVTFFSFSSSSSSLSLLSFKTYISRLNTTLFLSWRFSAAFLLCLAPVRPGCSLFLASFPSFSLWPTPIDRVSPSRCLKARHEAVSFEAAEWSERPTSRRVGWLGAAAAGSIPALVTFFSFSSSSSSLSLLSFKTYISRLNTTLFLSWRFSAAFLLCLAPVRPGCSLFLASFPSFSLWPTPIDRVSPSRCLKARHEAVSFEAAEWSERPTSRRVGWLGAAAAGSIPALVTFFSFSSSSSSSSSLSLLSTKKRQVLTCVTVANLHTPRFTTSTSTFNFSGSPPIGTGGENQTRICVSPPSLSLSTIFIEIRKDHWGNMSVETLSLSTLLFGNNKRPGNISKGGVSG